MRTVSQPSHILNFSSEIFGFEICSTDFAYNLMCVAFESTLKLGIISFPEESEEFDWEHLKEISVESTCRVICFAPDTSLATIPKTITVCASNDDFNLQIFRTDLQESDTIQLLYGHTDYINDVAWIADGEYIASVSDDQSCKIWNVYSNYECSNTFCMTSAGVAVKWHPEDPNKILVAEKRGIIHMYNLRMQQVVVSVESPKCPLLSADWAINNRLYITALAAGDIVTWDLSRPFVPADVKPVLEDGGTYVRFSPSSTELVFACVGRPDSTLKVFSAKSIVPLIESTLPICEGLAWHHRLPYVGVASDRKLLFWKVQMK